MNCRKLLSLGLLINLFPLTKALSQTDDVSYYNEAIKNTTNVYLSVVHANAPWMNGRINVPYGFQFEKGNPFFGSGKFEPSVLHYEGIAYNDVPLIYDEYSNKLLTLTTQGRVELINRRVDGFVSAGHEFIYLYNKNVPETFYEILYNGNSQVLKRNKKTLKEDLVSGVGIIRSIDEKLLYFVKRGDNYINVKSKKTLLAAFADHKPELLQLIKSKKLSWKKDAERLIVEVTSRYDQLTK